MRSARRVQFCRLAQSNRLAVDDDDAGIRECHLEPPGRRLERLARLGMRQGERQQCSALEDVQSRACSSIVIRMTLASPCRRKDAGRLG